MRINGFSQIKAFYSWVFENQDKHIRSVHISLYMFLINQNNRNNWVEWFKCPFDLAMSGAGISNKKTYYNALLDLQDWGLIKYKKGVNNYKAPLIKIEVLFDTATVPQSEPQVIPLPLPLLQPQLYNNIKLVTSNIKPITERIHEILKFLKINDEKTDKEITIYTKSDFLKDWNEIRTKQLKKPSHVNRLSYDGEQALKDICTEYNSEEIRNALIGLFKQEKLPNGNTVMQSNPNHFLKHFESYLQAYHDRNTSLYGKKETA